MNSEEFKFRVPPTTTSGLVVKSLTDLVNKVLDMTVDNRKQKQKSQTGGET